MKGRGEEKSSRESAGTIFVRVSERTNEYGNLSPFRLSRRGPESDRIRETDTRLALKLASDGEKNCLPPPKNCHRGKTTINQGETLVSVDKIRHGGTN